MNFMGFFTYFNYFEILLIHFPNIHNSQDGTQ